MAFVELLRVPRMHVAVVKGALEAEGITVHLDGSDVPDAAYGTLPYLTRNPALMVPEEQLDAARALIAEIEGEDG